MFLSLLGITFAVSLAVCGLVAALFHRPIRSILDRILCDAISRAWTTYLRFALFVTGISSGVNLHKIEQYITAPQFNESRIIELTPARWLLEVYRTVIETLQGIAWMLLTFFLFALIAFVIVRAFEIIRPSQTATTQHPLKNT